VDDYLPEPPASSAAPPLDGIDLSQALRQNDSTLRKEILLEIDVVRNTTAYRNGKWKLILGRSGDPTLFQEPTSWLTGAEADPIDRITEIIGDLSDSVLSYGGVGQGAKVVLFAINLRLKDWWHGTAYAFPTSLSVWNEVVPPTLEWDPPTGPRVFLFDLENDPYEENNLAFERRDVVEELMPALNALILDSPPQLSMDASAIDPEQEAPSVIEPILDDDTDVTQLVRPGIVRHMLLGMIKPIGVFVVTMGVIVTLLLYLCCKSRARPSPKSKSD